MIKSLKRISKHLLYERNKAIERNAPPARIISMNALVEETQITAVKLARVVIGLQSAERWFEQAGTENDTPETQLNIREALNRVRETLVIIGEGE